MMEYHDDRAVKALGAGSPVSILPDATAEAVPDFVAGRTAVQAEFGFFDPGIRPRDFVNSVLCTEPGSFSRHFENQNQLPRVRKPATDYISRMEVILYGSC